MTRIGAADPESCRALGELAVAHGFPAYGPEALEVCLGRAGGLVLTAGPGTLLVAELCAPEGEIHLVLVAPAERRRGLGAALVDACVRAAAARGVGRLFLEVAALNAPARRLYARLGFVEVGRRARYYPDGDDALVLARDLG